MLYHRVLITGANGLLGQELVALMSRFPEYDVLATGRGPAPRFEDASCGYVPLDVTAPQDVRRIFQDFSPGVVVNCAACTQVDLCEREREDCWAVNTTAVEYLAKQCDVTGARLIQVSTDFVFDGADGPYSEDARPNPVNFYGRSKMAAENALRGARLGNWGIARTVLVYGTGHDLGRSNIALWVIDNLLNGRTIRVVDDQWRTPTYASDLAAGIEKMIRYEKTGIYHLSGREFLTVYDFARTIAEVFDLDASLIQPTGSAQLSQKAPRPPRTGFIILKAETEMGYKPHTLHQGLRLLGHRLGLPVTAS
ncbi:MAG TPA: dTDP-4-dehydrorhamnose reductase [Rhodothermales bacterium]|nr:dTDP-4-dehydrorhamnose reductase [Rhodothermales bacterium]